MDMSNTPTRMSSYSNLSTPVGPRSTAQHSTQVSTTTLLNSLHTIYTSAQSYPLDASTSLVVNTWLTEAGTGDGQHTGVTIDGDMARRAWEHARRRAEDGCVVLTSLHRSTPSVIVPFITALPLSIPPTLYTALSVLRPFTCTVTPYNASFARYSALAATFTLTLTGDLAAVSLALSTQGINCDDGLLNISAEAGYRAFDVFYYLLTSASTPAEREFLSLKNPSAYTLLNRSGTFGPPSYLPTADDAASADDFRNSLRALGIKGSAHRSLLSVLAGLLKLGNALGFLIDEDELEVVCEEVGGLLGLQPEVLYQKCSTKEREVIVAAIYECLVDWVLMKANDAILADVQRSRYGASSSDSSEFIGARTPLTEDETSDTVSLTIVEIPNEQLGKAVALRGVFDDDLGINAEMKDDGVEIAGAGSSVVKEMHNAVADVAADLGIPGGPVSREREHERDAKLGVLEKVGAEAEIGGFIRHILYPVDGKGVNNGTYGRFDLPNTLGSSRVWYHLSLHPTDEPPTKLASLASTTSSWSAGTVSRQLRAWRLPEWANRRNKTLDFTADFDIDEFRARYARLGCKEGRDGVESWIMERGWSNGEAVVGHERVWIRESAWWEAELMLDMKLEHGHLYSQHPFATGETQDQNPFATGYSATAPGFNGSSFFPQIADNAVPQGSWENLLQRQQSSVTMNKSATGMARSVVPTMNRTLNTMPGDYGLGAKGDEKTGQVTYYDGDYDGEFDAELGEPKHITSQPISLSRRLWVAFVWALTFWIPSFLLRYIGRMKRPDVRMAWREKLVLVFMIFLLNATVVFYIVEFGLLLCPNFDKAWNSQEVSENQGDNDFYVSIHGKVYDISKFWKLQHSDTTTPTTAANMQQFAGMNLDDYFMPPLTVACQYLVANQYVQLTPNNSVQYSPAVHTSGPQWQPDTQSALYSINWYRDVFTPAIQDYYKGDLVWAQSTVTSQGQNEGRQWFILNGKIYDLTNYFYTLGLENKLPMYDFMPPDVTELITSNFGEDITSQWKNTANFTKALDCMDNAFYVGIPDFRQTARCQVNNYILLAFTIILCAVILVKFLSALQFGSKRRPAAQDKFVICQVPAYTEGEDQLRKSLDSLTALQYDNKRKLICVVCDGMIVGGGNDRPTPKIVLDILGVDPKIDPPALPFKSVGQGNEQLNYGKVYSGLYEYEGNVVPYIVVVKVGKESEQTKSKPGNRGKRDSQILLLSFLNRVHHRSPMSPLELEMFHQINNIIGVDPELYEYLFMVDADTSVREDSLNRLVASCANDAKIAGICGETSLENEQRSWWTMIQVYEYYISHHLAKAFESLFGSVTCLPGCFCMYRIRTADKGRPLIISDKIINEYSDCQVDTLHKKNLLALGEDRYLTTLMTKHFPGMSYKFVPDAYAATAAPETWSVLLSQRRRWINSTIHNLAELVFLNDLCGFCCFSMRFVVFIDLFGTIILPATCTYLGYLIYRVATHSGQFPLISIIMIAAVYGLQALIFILKRQWQHIGWMIIYILAFPIYSFVLPIFSFWKQDDFSWGNTRIVIGEKGNKQIIAMEDDGFNPRSVPLQRWDDYAAMNSLPGRRGIPSGMEKPYQDDYVDNNYEMDDIRSSYSSIKPASTILTGFPNRAPAYLPPVSPAPYGNVHRQSTYSSFTPYTDQPQYQQPRHQSMVGMPEPYRDSISSPVTMLPTMRSSDSLMGMPSPPLRQSRSPLGYAGSRPISTVDFRGASPNHGPDDMAIAEAIRLCLAEVDLDSVTKKQVRALVEQRLQTELTGGRRIFLDQQIDTELANMYTTSFAFFEALWEACKMCIESFGESLTPLQAGVAYCFVNLGSDHPSIIEAMVKGQNERKGQFPRIITCPNEMVALSMADGYARVTGKPQCVIVHVDVGTQGLGAAVHNASCGRAPVLIFAGLSPFTIDGELRGSRTEYIHWIQDVPDQKQIVSQYCRYTGELKTGKNVKQMVRRALQFAMSSPAGPVYLYGAREVMEEEMEPYSLVEKEWQPLAPSALPNDAIKMIAEALVGAKEPLVVTGYSGRNHAAVGELVKLTETIRGLRVLDTGGSDVCFPANHRASLGLRYGSDPSIETADVILVSDCDVPWIPTQCRPKQGARIFHVDVDPLKQQMPVAYIAAEARWKADSATVFKQLHEYVTGSEALSKTVAAYDDRWTALDEAHKKRLSSIRDLAQPSEDGNYNASYLTAAIRKAVPPDTIFAIEAVTSTVLVADQLQASIPGTYINCGGGGLGWSGGAALGIKLASGARFVCQIVGDGTFLFSVPGSVYWIAQRYRIPILTVVLNNKGWHAPRRSLLLVHPDGLGSKVSNEDLNISFAPTPDYAGIAKAASGGVIWAEHASTVQELDRLLPQAVAAVMSGRSAVLDAHLDGSEGKYVGVASTAG